MKSHLSGRSKFDVSSTLPLGMKVPAEEEPCESPPCNCKRNSARFSVIFPSSRKATMVVLLNFSITNLLQKQQMLVSNKISNISTGYPIDSCATCNWPWQALAFLPLPTSSLLTKIGIIYTQFLHEEKIFPMMPKSKWLAKAWDMHKNAKKV